MAFLIAGLALLFGSHLLFVSAWGWRERLIAVLGRPAWRLAHSALMLAGAALIVWGYAQARLDPIAVYEPPLVLRYATMALMAIAAILFVASFLPGRLIRRVPHPLFTAVLIWASAHLIANGALADLVLFAGMATGTLIAFASAPRPKPPEKPSAWFDAAAVAGGLILFVVVGRWLHPLLIGVDPMQSISLGGLP